jgi:hypothetical protein
LFKQSRTLPDLPDGVLPRVAENPVGRMEAEELNHPKKE